MTDFQMVHGIEDVWRPPIRPRMRALDAVLGVSPRGLGNDARARLALLANRAPEVMERSC